MLLADGNGPVVTSLSELGPIRATGVGVTETVATSSPYVFDGVLPKETQGWNWWLIGGALFIVVLILLLIRYLTKK